MNSASHRLIREVAIGAIRLRRTENRVGCEACHGPRAVHAETQELAPSTDCTLCDIRKECIKCHNRSIDPGFDAVDDWKIINHGKDKP